MQLANLDNEIFFKKVFTDLEVFRAFVRDITGVDIIDAKIETEKRLEIQDWLEFILSSIKTPNNPKFNEANAAIVKAAALADMENMPESVLEDAKIAEAKNKTARIYATIEHNKGIEEGKVEKEKENVIKPYIKGKSAQEISDFLDIPI
jgi:hypothetical protein